MVNKSKEEVTFSEVHCNICGELMDWEDDIREWVCPVCGNRAFQTDDCEDNELYFEHYPEDDYDEYYDPEDMSPDKDGF